MSRKVIPWLVFYGTQTALVNATSQRGAFIAFLAAEFPDTESYGRIMPPTQKEVVVRPLSADDADWINDCRDVRFMNALRRI